MALGPFRYKLVTDLAKSCLYLDDQIVPAVGLELSIWGGQLPRLIIHPDVLFFEAEGEVDADMTEETKALLELLGWGRPGTWKPKEETP